MRHIFILLSLVFVISCGQFEGGDGFSGVVRQRQVIQRTGHMTVALVSYNSENSNDLISNIQIYCSGVWVNEKYILTAYHCIEGEKEHLQQELDRKRGVSACSVEGILNGTCSTYKVESQEIETLGMPIHYIVWEEASKDYRGEPSAWHLGNVKGWDKRHDLALVEVVEKFPHLVAQLPEELPEVGDTVHICGHPSRYGWTFLDGMVAGYRQRLRTSGGDIGPFMQVQAPVYYGNSGGGAFDRDGKLVGIADRLNGVPGEGLFVDLVTIRKFLANFIL